MTGKETCAILKQIRRDIAKQNDINLRIDECTHKGECKGTCPRCEAEVRALEKALAERKKRGQRVAVAGISAGLVAFNMAACQPIGNKPDVQQTTGIVPREEIESEEPEKPEVQPLAGVPTVRPDDDNGQNSQ